MVPLPGAVTTVDKEVGTGSVRGSVRGEVDEGSLELGGLGITAHWDHVVPHLLDLLVDEVGETGVNVAGGDGIDTSEVAPFVGEGASQVDAAGLGHVVGGLEGERVRYRLAWQEMERRECLPAPVGSSQCDQTWKQ